MRKAIIGGTGVYEILDERTPLQVDTPYGVVQIDAVRLGAEEVFFLPRHGKNHTIPPHRINYKANIMALKQLEVESIIATAAVGSCNVLYKPGDLVVMKDFIDFTKSRPSTFFEDSGTVCHVKMDQPYCPTLSQKIYEQAKKLNIEIAGSVVYTATEGPRFETAAEIRMFAALGGDVVGMTSVPEVVLAHEVGICYASIGIVTNMCTGFADSSIASHNIMEIMKKSRNDILDCCSAVFADTQVKRCCSESETLV